MPVNKKIVIKGTVQGVGFRPFIWNLARKIGVKGFILNSSQGVVIEAWGEEPKIEKFISEIKIKKPKAAVINSVEVFKSSSKKYTSFTIKQSRPGLTASASIPADMAICRACLKDIKKNGRRKKYPFTNCTDCGPRFSIVRKIPYDRPFTTMSFFKMCKFCQEEYETPSNRRFHAQPNACSVCGPDVLLREKSGKIYKKEEAIKRLADIIIASGVVAIKGLGGFHLACDSESETAVKKLRKFKNRIFKPFALMCDDLSYFCDKLFISKEEKKLLFSQESPIVMIRKKDNNFFNLAAPNLNSVGIMSPYTPLHKIIFSELMKKGFKKPLIMTSGNLRDEPIIKDNKEALKLFSDFDAVLTHNRDIHNRIDDSVAFLDKKNNLKLIRRARGYVPYSIKIKVPCKKEIYACGADIKNSFALSRKNEVFLSQHIGDLDEKLNFDFHKETLKKMSEMLLIKPVVSVADSHPEYRSTKIAEDLRLKISSVQHHVAHFFSVMAEHSLLEDSACFSFDGTGYGPDGKIWGGEVFLYQKNIVERYASLKYFPLPGGDLCTSEIYRSFISLAYTCGIEPKDILKLKNIKPLREKADIVLSMIKNKVNCAETSSMGRVFDAFASLILNKNFVTYEAQAAMELESVFKPQKIKPYSFEIEKNGQYFFDFSSGMRECLKDVKRGEKPEKMSYKFHSSIVELIYCFSKKIKSEQNINNICFSGGVFQNRVLVNLLIEKFEKTKFNIYFNSKAPSNDGGIALGQIYFNLLNPALKSY